MTGLSHLDVARRPGALSLPAVAPGVAGNRAASLRNRLNRSADAALTAILTALPDGAAVLDVGCQGWTVAGRAARIGRGDLRHAGCDLEERAAPPGAEFRSADLRTDTLPWDDDSFDCVVLSHMLEHLTDPGSAFGEAVRVCRPGGTIYVETPSDRALSWSFPWAQHLHLILSYWDDPTHVGRPFTPQALYRLAIYWSCIPVVTRYDQRLADILLLPLRMIRAVVSRDPDAAVEAWWRAVGWCCYGVMCKRPDVSGKPRMTYFSFKGIRAGKNGAEENGADPFGIGRT